MIELDKAYQCEYCGKIFTTKGGTHTHESHCRRNERNARACYTCKHYDDARVRPYDEDNPKEVDEIADFEYCCGMAKQRRTLLRNICKAERSLLFNPRRMNAAWKEWLENSDEWKPMPTAFEGCENYEPYDYGYCKGGKPKYPVSHKIIK